MVRRSASDRCLECETCIGGKCSRHIEIARLTDTCGNRPQGVVVSWETEFKFSHMGAAHKANHNPTSCGKRMIETSFGNNAPTQVNLPHNQFVKRKEDSSRPKPPPPGSAQHAAAEIFIGLRRAAKDGSVSLLEATLTRASEASERPFQEWIDAELDNYGSTALHYAAQHGRSSVLRTLVAKGANVNARNKEHKTPLHLAASNGTASGVRALVESGRADLQALNLAGETPMDCAEIWGNIQTGPVLRQLAHQAIAGTQWRVQSANRLDQPRRIASYKNDGMNDDWAVAAGFARGHIKHHVSVQRVGVYPCTEAWGCTVPGPDTAKRVIAQGQRRR